MNRTCGFSWCRYYSGGECISETVYEKCEHRALKARLTELAQNSPNACTDTISRQAVIDALSCCQTYLFDSRDKDPKISIEDAEYTIEQLPSAQATGQWIRETVPTIDGLNTRTQVRCSECGEEFITDVNYCPNCGAKMEDGE